MEGREMRKKISAVIILAVFFLVCLTGSARGAWEFERLSNNTGASDYPEIANSGSNLHLVWQDTSYGNIEIFYKRSINYGGFWSFQRLTTNSGQSLRPDVAASGTNIYLVWYDSTFTPTEILYKRSTDNGSSWAYQRLTNNSGNSYYPAVAASGSNVHVVWHDGSYGNNDILYKRSTNNGSSWSFQRISANAGESRYPDIAATGTSIHVVWQDGTYGGNDEIFYKRSTNNGSTWSFQRLTSNAGTSLLPSVAVDGSTVHVVWHDTTYGSNPDIFHKMSTNNGSTWSFQRLTTNSGWSGYSRVAAAGGYVHVVWRDTTYGGTAEIFYKLSTDTGSTWNFTRLTDNSGHSELPALVYNTGLVAVFVVWQDDSYGNNDIFFKRGW
jgi:hypothetical protein